MEARQDLDVLDETWMADAAEMSDNIPEPLRVELGELGLSPYEARVLMALLRLGSANTLQIARATGVPRTSTYQVLESLAARRLAVRVPGGRAAVWAAAGRDEVFERLEGALETAHSERLRQHRAHAERARQLLVESTPPASSVTLPFVHMLMGPTEVKNAYDEMLTRAKGELLMFTRPPYVVVPGRPKAPVLEMLARGVSARVLYQADKWEEPEAHAFRQELSVYHEAGVQARLAERLPIKLVLVDGRSALVGMSDPIAPESGYPVHLLVEHPGYVAIQAAAFERLWESSRPLTAMPASAGEGDLAEQLGDVNEFTDLSELDTRPDQA